MSIDKFGRHYQKNHSNQETEEYKQIIQNHIKLAITFAGYQYLPTNLDITDKEQWKLMTSPDLFDKAPSFYGDFKHWYEKEKK